MCTEWLLSMVSISLYLNFILKEEHYIVHIKYDGSRQVYSRHWSGYEGI